MIMKRLFILILLCLAITSCEQKDVASRSYLNYIDHNYDDKLPIGYDVLVIDSCEYISAANQITHKGNCKYCEKRYNK